MKVTISTYNTIIAYAYAGCGKSSQCIEKTILRRILEPVRDGDGWRIRYNSKLNDIYDDPLVPTLIKLRKLKRSDHVWRIEEEKYQKVYCMDALKGPAGKPRRI